MENENGLNTVKKLMSIQTELKAPKGQYNEFSNFNYRSCEDILNAVKPLLKKYKVTVVLSDEMEQIGERYYIKATAQFIDTESTNVIQATAYAREQSTKKGMDESQITGAASSYARKYALNGLFAIDNTKDADAMNNTETEAAAEQKYYCSDCGNEIISVTNKGKTYTPEMLANASVKKYGRAVCVKCANQISKQN